MNTYKLYYTKFSEMLCLEELEKAEIVNRKVENFSTLIMENHPVNSFFMQVATGNNKIEFKGITFNIEGYSKEEEIKFTSEANFDTVARTLLRFTNKYKISFSLFQNKESHLTDLQCCLKVEYVNHYDEPNGDFLVFKSFYLNTINVTKSYITNNFFHMFMKFKHESEVIMFKNEEGLFKGIFADTWEDACFNIDIGEKAYCTVYTDATIEKLANFLFLIDSKEKKELS